MDQAGLDRPYRALFGPAPTADELALFVAQARGGDEDAFDRLCRGQWRAAYRQCRRLLGDAEDAADATVATFETAWERLGELREPGAFGGWLHGIAANLCRAERRHRPPQHEPLDGPAAMAVADESAEPVDVLLRPELHAELAEAVAALPPDEGRVVAARFWQGLTVLETARALGIPVGTAKARQRRAYTRLRLLLDGDG